MMDFSYKTAKKKQKFGIMPSKFKYPTRMCIVCKGRLLQSSLFRYQVKNSSLVSFDGFGRSFYVCKDCLEKDEEKLQKILCGKFKVRLKYSSKTLKEISTNGR